MPGMTAEQTRAGLEAGTIALRYLGLTRRPHTSPAG